MKYLKIKILILFFTAIWFNILPSFTQDDDILNAWVELGSCRFFPVEKESGVGINLDFKFQKNKILSTLQYQDYFDRDLAHGGFELFTSSNHYHAGNILIGITNKKCRHGHASISSGLGVFWGIFNEISEEKFKTVGWPIEAESSLNINSFIGINLKVFTNINPKHSIVGFGMDIQFGKLRRINLDKFL